MFARGVWLNIVKRTNHQISAHRIPLCSHTCFAPSSAALSSSEANSWRDLEGSTGLDWEWLTSNQLEPQPWSPQVENHSYIPKNPSKISWWNADFPMNSQKISVTNKHHWVAGFPQRYVAGRAMNFPKKGTCMARVLGQFLISSMASDMAADKRSWPRVATVFANSWWKVDPQNMKRSVEMRDQHHLNMEWWKHVGKTCENDVTTSQAMSRIFLTSSSWITETLQKG